MSNSKDLPWIPLKLSNQLCCICGLEDGFPTPLIMSRDPSSRGKTVCKPCFVMWIDCGITDTDEIKKRRHEMSLLEHPDILDS